MPVRRTLSLRNRLALVFFTITLLSVAALYVYVAPGLQSRLMGEKLSSLAQSARAHSDPLRRTVGSSTPLPKVRRIIARTANLTGNRVTLISVNQAGGLPQLARVADSSNAAAGGAVRLAIAERAVVTRKVATGTESTAPVTDVLRTVSTVRHEILVAGGLALLVALVVGYLVARALAQRVKRLELAAKQVAAGEFTTPIPVDSADELGQLAAAFNDMQKQLLQMEAARKKFIATASHELRTPVFSLGGFVELLEDEELDPETRRRFLEQVREQVQRLGKLSVDLLDLSRLESGSLELRPEEVDLGELTRSVSGEFEPTLAQHDARLAVRDNGEGIDTTALPRIFEPFYTADDAQGSGLGLAIASELAGRMAGRLSVDSTSGVTTFTLEIPA